MKAARYWITHNWFLKVVSLLLATLLWAAVSNQASSEIELEVPLEYRNIPPRLEITGDVTTTVEVRLRGSTNAIKDVSPKDVTATVDLSKMKTGEKIVALSSNNVQAPFGAEIIRVTPSSVKFTLEQTVVKAVRVEPMLLGSVADEYEAGDIRVTPNTVEVEGPESRVSSLSSIPTAPIRVDSKQSSFQQTAALDIPDPQIRVRGASSVEVHIDISPRKR